MLSRWSNMRDKLLTSRKVIGNETKRMEDCSLLTNKENILYHK
jgi:hypothetical protein